MINWALTFAAISMVAAGVALSNLGGPWTLSVAKFLYALFAMGFAGALFSALVSWRRSAGR